MNRRTLFVKHQIKDNENLKGVGYKSVCMGKIKK